MNLLLLLISAFSLILIVQVDSRSKEPTRCRFRSDTHDIDLMVHAIEDVCNKMDCPNISFPSNLEEHTLRPLADNLLDQYWKTVGQRQAKECWFNGLAEIYCGEKDPTTPKLRGVDLGGWLVLEPWITPSLFQQFLNASYNFTAVDELTFGKYLGQAAAQAQLEQHWSTWVTEEDFQNISNAGLNFVRIPFGWWILGAPPYYISGLQHLDRGVALAYKYNISVLLDLHGAPGSQNGFDNSGMACASSQWTGYCATPCPQDPEWINYDSNLNYTIYVLTTIAQRYSNYSNIWGIELVNEPRYDLNLTTLQAWYIQAYTAIRPLVPNWYIVMHDSFRPESWVGFMNNTSEYTTVMMDTHVYYVFSVEFVTQTLDAKLQAACAMATTIDFFECEELPVITGEWSLGINDCALWLDGMEAPTRAFENNVSCALQPSDTFYFQYAQSQLWAFERGQGWAFWNFKVELEDDWSYLGAIQKGWIPSNASDIPNFISTACNASSLYQSATNTTNLETKKVRFQ